jgi:hypothetical protein
LQTRQHEEEKAETVVLRAVAEQVARGSRTGSGTQASAAGAAHSSHDNKTPPRFGRGIAALHARWQGTRQLRNEKGRDACKIRSPHGLDTTAPWDYIPAYKMIEI